MNRSLDILQQFSPISLKEMDRVKLMDRTDTKFTFDRSRFDSLLEEILNYYCILEIDGKRVSRYRTLYYDTKQLELYFKHHKGQLNRYKIRHRTYIESNIGFLEVKFKNNKGRTIKNRIKKNEIMVHWDGESQLFLTNSLPFKPQTLVPTLWVNYSRLTLVNKTSAERLTIDIDLEYIKDDYTKQMKSLVIAEVKQEKRSPSPFLKLMKKHHIREGSISKYCMGIALTCKEAKRNNFKRKLLNLKHIIHDDITPGSR